MIRKLWRKLFRRNKGWVSGGSYTITVPPGKWTIGQKITFKKNGKIKAEPPTLTETKALPKRTKHSK